MAAMKYGYVKGPDTIVNLPLAASQAFSQVGGGFVKVNASGHLEVCGATDDFIYGWADVPFGNVDRMSGSVFTSSSTAGKDSAVVHLASNTTIFRIPSDATVAATIIGNACDLVVASSVQQADIGEEAKQVLRIVDVSAEDITDTTVLVVVNAIQAN